MSSLDVYSINDQLGNFGWCEGGGGGEGVTTDYRVQKDWHWPMSGVHSIRMVKSAQPGEGEGARHPPPPSFTLSTFTPSRAKLCCTLQLRGQIHPSYFSYTLFSSVGVTEQKLSAGVSAQTAVLPCWRRGGHDWFCDGSLCRCPSSYCSAATASYSTLNYSY